jgi:uncharacterized membrane protein
MTKVERTLSLAAGAALLLHGCRKGGLSGALQVAAGAYGVIRGAAGHCALKRVLTPTPYETQFSREHQWPISEAITRWVDSVEQLTPDTALWKLRAPAGRRLQCALVQIDTQDRHVLHWKTPGDARWAHDITVSLSPAPAGRGTQVKAVVVCKPAMAKLGYGLARAISLFSDKALLNALQAVKQQLETGEVSNNRSRPEQDDDFFYVHAGADQVATDHPSAKTGVVIEGGPH